MANKIVDEIMDHEDKDEILVKLISDNSLKDINGWLKAKYKDQPQLVVSIKTLQTFKNEYLDLYTKVREDIMRSHFNAISKDDVKTEIQGNKAYKDKLSEIADKELDIKLIIKNLVTTIDFRAQQVFDTIQEDPRNFKMDKVLIDWLSLLLTTLEKFDKISNGTIENITVNNNINIQVVDNHINMVYSVIREILSQLDNETSLLFTELFSKRLAELKESENKVISVDKRLDAAYKNTGLCRQEIRGVAFLWYSSDD